MKTGQYFTATMRRKARLVALLGASALAAPFVATPALAQSSDDASVDSNTIIVTAQRRSEAVEDVPMSVAVVTPETLAALGVNTIRDLQNVTSGFSLNQSGTYPQPAIRGVTTTNSGSYENNVALWVDGLYQITPQVLNMDLPNVQSIQVLKGPQGALYGRNATGGAILLDTLDPTSDMSGNVEATYGRFNDRRARGYVSGPLSDKIGFSLAGTYRKTDGYYKKVVLTDPTRTKGRGLGLEQESIRAKVKADLTDTFRATVAYNYTGANDPRGTFFTAVENLTSSTGVTTPARQLGEFAGDAFALDFKQHEGSLKLELETGIGTLRSVTGFQHSSVVTTYDSDGRYSSSANAGTATETYADSKLIDNTWQENLDFTITAIDKLDLIVGGTYFRNSEKYAPGRGNVTYLFPSTDPTKLAGTPLSAYSKLSDVYSTRTKEAWAGFIDATFHATDELSINVGGRYSTETQHISSIKTCYLVNFSLGCPVATVPTVRYNASAQSTYSKFTPRASIRYEIAPRTNVYFNYSQGFKAGEWNGVIPGDNPATWRQNGQIGQETINSFELGLKSGAGRLRFDLAGFYNQYRHIQVSSVQFVNGVTSVLLQSLPRAKIYGIEGNIDYDVTSNFKVRGGGTWLHARYGKGAYYRGAGVDPAGSFSIAVSADPLKNFRNTSPAAPLWQDLSGLQMARAPKFSGYVGAEYNVPNGEGGLRFAANLKYTSSYVVTDPSIWGGETDASYQAHKATNPAPNNLQTFTAAGAAGAAYLSRANEERARQGAYALVNASITWTDPSDHFYVRAWGNNLTDKKYKVHYRPSSRTYAPIGEPLTFGGTVGYKF